MVLLYIYVILGVVCVGFMTMDHIKHFDIKGEPPIIDQINLLIYVVIWPIVLGGVLYKVCDKYTQETKEQ